MSTIPVIAGTTAAVVKRQFSTNNYNQPIVASAFGLAAAEEVDVFVGGSGGWVPATDEAGAAVKLTATVAQVTLQPGPLYAFDKDASVGAAGVDVSVSI